MHGLVLRTRAQLTLIVAAKLTSASVDASRLKVPTTSRHDMCFADVLHRELGRAARGDVELDAQRDEMVAERVVDVP